MLGIRRVTLVQVLLSLTQPPNFRGNDECLPRFINRWYGVKNVDILRLCEGKTPTKFIEIFVVLTRSTFLLPTSTMWKITTEFLDPNTSCTHPLMSKNCHRLEMLIPNPIPRLQKFCIKTSLTFYQPLICILWIELSSMFSLFIQHLFKLNKVDSNVFKYLY